MSEDTIAFLRSELDRSRKEAQGLREDRAGKVKAAEERAKAAEDKFTALNKEHDKVNKKLESLPGELLAENDRLKGEIRNRDHKTKFADVAKESGADPTALEALYKLSDYKADKDEVDVAQIKDVIGKTLEANPFLRAKDATPAPKPGPAGGQGAKATNPAGSFSMTRQQASDGRFQSENRLAIQEASSKGNLHIMP